MTDRERRLLDAGRALADACKSFRIAYVLQDTVGAQLRCLADVYETDAAFRALEKEMEESHDDQR